MLFKRFGLILAVGLGLAGATTGGYFAFKKFLADRTRLTTSALLTDDMRRRLASRNRDTQGPLTAKQREEMKKKGLTPPMTQPYNPPQMPDTNDTAMQRAQRAVDEINRINQLNQRLMEEQQRINNVNRR